MSLGGCQLNRKQAIALCRAVGFRGRRLVTAVAVMGAESGRWTGAYNDTNPNGTVDRGLFQINSIHKAVSEEEAFKAVPNARYAFQLSRQGRDFTPWAAYNNGAYLVNVPAIAASLAMAKANLWTLPLADRVADIINAGDDWDPCAGRT